MCLNAKLIICILEPNTKPEVPMGNKFHFKAICIILILFIVSGCAPVNKKELRILTAGIRHESNSFMPYLTNADDFIVLRGTDISKDQVNNLKSLGSYIRMKSFLAYL